jgi:TRAP-type mannitol/chloroaromatic compound transport system permease small subunit
VAFKPLEVISSDRYNGAAKWHQKARKRVSGAGLGEDCRMGGLLKFSRAIDAMNTWLGRYVAWAILVAVIISAVNAVIRKAFGMSSNTWLELQWILFGAVFLLCSPWTLLSNEHIRIDVVSSALPKSVRNWIDIIGHLFFLIPICLVMMYTAWPFFWRSLMQNEQSTNAGGLPQYPSKLFVPLCFTILLVQGVSELIKRAAIMRGELADVSGGGHHEAAEAEATRLREALAAEADAKMRAQAELLGKSG